jgi:3-oxoadipate enol-lactonase
VTQTVVLCGSLGSTAAMWDPQAPALAGREVVRVELPGHGAAPVAEARSVAELAAHVLDAAPGSFDFVGLSLGGAIGMHLAVSHPGRVERLVLACTSPSFGEPAAWHERAATVRAQGLEAIVDAVLGRWFTAGFDEVERYRRMFCSVDREGYARCCEAIATWAGEALERVAAPTLVIAGADDPTSPPAHARGLATRIEGARVAVIEGAAHLANVERAEEFNRLLEEAL